MIQTFYNTSLANNKNIQTCSRNSNKKPIGCEAQLRAQPHKQFLR